MPERPENHLSIQDPFAVVGCLRPSLHSEIMRHLRAAEGVELIEDINIHAAAIRSGSHWAGNLCLDDLDAFFWYCEVDRRPGSFDILFLQSLARKVRVVRDPFDFELALDKFAAHERLRAAGVPVPDTVLFDLRVPDFMEQTLAEWGAGVLKPRRGGWGKGVTMVRSHSQLRDFVGYVMSTAEEAPDYGFFLERYLPNDLSKWISITMVGGEVAYGYRKVGAKLHDMGGGAMKVLDAEEKGGGVVLGWPTEEEMEMVKAAWEALGKPGLIGFDLIHTEQGPVVVDENTSPGNYLDLYQEAGLDAGKLFADWILKDAMGK